MTRRRVNVALVVTNGSQQQDVQSVHKLSDDTLTRITVIALVLLLDMVT